MTAVTEPGGSVWPPPDLAPMVLALLLLADQHRLYVAGRSNLTAWTDAEYESARSLGSDAATLMTVLMERGLLVEAWYALLLDESGNEVDTEGLALTPSGRGLYDRLNGDRGGAR